MIAKIIAILLYIIAAMQTHTRNIVWEITATRQERACTACYNSCQGDADACHECNQPIIEIED